MDTFTVTISGISMETEHQYMTGNVLRRYLLKMMNMHDASVPKSPGMEYMAAASESGAIFAGDNIVNLSQHNDFLLTPVQVR